MIIFKVSYDKGGGNKSIGARFGPHAIERSFKNTGWRVAEDGTPHPALLWMPASSSLEQYRKQAESVYGDTYMPFITLSGDNSCSFETVQIVAQHVKHVALAVFDAHPDACDPSHHPHAHWVRKLWDEGIVMPTKTIFFGIHDVERDEAQYIKKREVIVVNPDDVYALCSTHVGAADAATYYIPLWHRWHPIPVHALVIVVDIDVLDPAYAPGTGVLRAGGLHVRHVLRIIKDLCALPFSVRIGEICEVIPKEGNRTRPRSDQRPDPCGLTILAAEAILREMIRSMCV